MARRLAAIMFSDIDGFTALTQRDEKAALELLQEQESLVLPLLETHRGRRVKSTGDGLLVEFSNALDAIEYAVDLQRRVLERNSGRDSEPLRLRMAIHLGDVQDVGTDLFGDAVNLAARILPISEPGGVCMSEPVYVQVRNRVPYQIEKLGSRSLKGVRGPMDLYRVVLPWEHEQVPTRALMSRRLVAIMITDVVGFTASAQANEADALARLREQEEILRPLFEPFKGREIKSTGDGFLVEFESALGALECAVEIQRRMRERNSNRPRPPSELRIGIHVGDVEESGGDIFGDAVNIASRVEPLAEPGGVCLSEPVYVQVRNKVPYPLEKLGPKTLKGVREPVEVYRVRLPWAVSEVPTGSSTSPRLAVLPLANISPDPKDEYFADGLTEELISVLSQVRGLRVIARTSVMPYKSAPKPIPQIGVELGVDSVLEGSVRKAGNQLRITVQLVDVRTQEHRWAKTYDRTLENVFAIQAEVAEQTAGALKVELLRSEREAIRESPTASVTAYEFYLRGIREWQQGYWEGHSVQEHVGQVTKLFERAIQEDPKFSAAYSGLANFLLGQMSDVLPERVVGPRVRELVAKALELNPNSSDAHSAQGNLAFQVDHEWTRAEAEFQQAIALNPSNAAARFWYGFLLQVLQRYTEAKKQYLAAIEIDPLWLGVRRNLVWVTMVSNDLASAVSSAEALLERFPDNLLARGTLAWMYAFAGRREEAVELTAPLAAAPDLDPWSNRAAVLAYLGQPQEARALLAAWEEGRLPWYLSLLDAAAYYALVGDTEKALSVLEREQTEGDRALWAPYRMSWFDSIRNDPRFVAMIRAMKLPTTVASPDSASTNSSKL
jgi:class 3 adenylate cyclase/TolB-like protein